MSTDTKVLAAPPHIVPVLHPSKMEAAALMEPETPINTPPQQGAQEKRDWRDWHWRLPEPVQEVCKKITEILDGAVVLIIIAIATLVTIFLADIDSYAFGPGADWNFACASTFFFCLFSFEMVLNCLVRPGYFCSGFFLMDLVSAFSIIPDIYWFWNPMIGLRVSDSDDNDDLDVSVVVDRIKRVSTSTKKLLKVLKFVKLIRLGRIAKLFEMAQRTYKERQRAKRRAERALEDDSDSIDLDDYTQSSQVGQKLSEQTIRNVVLLVLLMLFGIPMLQATTTDDVGQFMVSELNTLASTPETFGTVTAYNTSSNVYAALEDDDDAPANVTLVVFSTQNLSALLTGYSATLGQPIDKTTLSSGDVNYTYVATVVAAPYVNVTYLALRRARAQLEQQFQWILDYYSGTILYLRVRGQYYSNDYQSSLLFDHRTSEMRAAEAGSSINVLSQLSNTQQTAWYSIWTSFTTVILLFLGALAFEYNNRRMVIVPIERMVATIVQLRKNPLAKAVVDDGEGHSPSDASAETGMLERTLQKLTGLLQVGFGDAGSRMIQKCMNQNSEGDLDPLVDGTRMLAIFGFCDIRRFTDATECLREDVMMYVNEIASIVHSHVSICDGHPNKNVGDAFLVMWRLAPHHAEFDPDDLFQLNEVQPEYLRPTLGTIRARAALTSDSARAAAVDEQRQTDARLLSERAKQASASYPPVRREITPLSLAQISVLADKAVVSFLRIIVDLDASDQLRMYENHPRIKAAFDDFIVQLGFGLHCGWSIEGPIGSRYKIDASYLSPHVNLSEALQDLTKLYGTPLLVSGEFYTLLSPYLKAHMRRVDVVKVVGRDIPMNLYAFDIHPTAMRTIIARQTPDQYDTEADIDVVDLRASVFTRYKPRQTNSISPAPSENGPAPISPLPATSPLSPQSPFDPHADPLMTHALFGNPSLNPLEMDFRRFEYSGAERERIHGLGPVATYHLVYNFRLSALQCGIPYAFHDVYESGLALYLAGDWPAARAKMDECHQLYPEDVPTTVILDVMKEHNFVAPDDWPGWHEA